MAIDVMFGSAQECQPHWFLPVAPVEGRIAAAMVRGFELWRWSSYWLL